MSTRTHSSRPFILTALAAIALGLSLPPSQVNATGVAPNVREGSEIVMKDLRWPVFDQGTYYCFWYVSFFPESYGTFYGGIATKGENTAPGMFMSYWGNITNIHEGEYFYRHGYGAEGSKGGAHGKALFMEPNSWYRMVLRIFPPATRADKKTYVGWWVKDVAKNEWHTHSVVSIDTRATGVRGNSGFVEALAPESVHRAFERRLGYCRVDGKWFKSSTITTGSPQFFKLINDGTVLRYDKSQPDSPGAGTKIELTAKQSDAPTLDRPAIENAAVTVHENQLAAQWRIPRSASPQLGYKLEVFDNASAKGTPMAVFEDAAPHVLAKRLDLDRPAQSVRLTVTDIFDQKTSVTMAVGQSPPAAAKDSDKLRPGLKYTYYEAPSGTSWEQLPDFSQLTPAKQGIVKTIDDTVREDRDKLYALRYTGFIQAPRTGLYVLELGTCDGGRLSIDGRVVADNDGLHGTSVRQYPLALEAGLHSIELAYFKGSESYLADKILFAWEGPGQKTRKFTLGDFLCEDNSDTPAITMPAVAMSSNGVLKDNLVSLQPKIQSRGHRIAKVQFYRDRQLLSTAVNDPSTGDGNLTFRNLLPAGENNLWARLWYDDHCSVDSDVLRLKAENKTEGPWTFDTLGESMFPLAVRQDEGRISFRGDGFCFGHQPVSGDFTLTARVAEIGLSNDENGIHRSNWLGLYVQDNLRGPFSGHRFGVYCTAGGMVKGSADFPDLAGTYMGIPTLPADHRWLQLVRRGSRFVVHTSADGHSWQKAMDRITRTKQDVYAGIVFRSVPGKSRTLFYGAFENVTLTSDVSEE
ncbi:MAG: PA14 domain-containing protein, partial [Thermoguttaceae bacterium]